MKLIVALAAALALPALAPSVAHADERCSSTLTVDSPGSTVKSSVYMCVTTPFTQQPTAGDPLPVVAGDQLIEATLHWNPLAAQPGAMRGCSGQRKTPSGCVSWTVNAQSRQPTCSPTCTTLRSTPMTTGSHGTPSVPEDGQWRRNLRAETAPPP